MKTATVTNWERLPAVIDIQMVALIFGVTDGTVKRWIYSGEIEGRKIGRQWFFDRDYFRELIQGR